MPAYRQNPSSGGLYGRLQAPHQFAPYYGPLYRPDALVVVQPSIEGPATPAPASDIGTVLAVATAGGAGVVAGNRDPTAASGAFGSGFKSSAAVTFTQAVRLDGFGGRFHGLGGAGQESFYPFIYDATGAAGSPGNLVYAEPTNTIVVDALDAVADREVRFTTPQVLAPGTYWIGVKGIGAQVASDWNTPAPANTEYWAGDSTGGGGLAATWNGGGSGGTGSDSKSYWVYGTVLGGGEAISDTGTNTATGAYSGTEGVTGSGNPSDSGTVVAAAAASGTEAVADSTAAAPDIVQATASHTGADALADAATVQATASYTALQATADTGSSTGTATPAPATEAIADRGGTVGGSGSLPPDGLLAATNLAGTYTDVDEDPASPDGAWMTANDTTAQVLARYSFPTPPGTLGGTQVVRALVRATGATPNVRIDIYEGGSLVATGTPQAVSSASGQVVSQAFNASVLADPSGANAEVVVVGGPGV